MVPLFFLILHEIKIKLPQLQEKMKRYTRAIMAMAFLMAVSYIHGQRTTFFDIEQQIKKLHDKLGETESITRKFKINDSIHALFDNLFNVPDVFDHPFDSLYRFGTLSPEDQRFRIIQWGLPLVGGMYEYHGYILINQGETKAPAVIRLRDQSDSIKEVESFTGGPGKWYGALYYDVITTDYHGKKLYTFLGFDFNDMASRKKLIETVRVFGKDSVQFGVPVFVSPARRAVRVVFEYSPKVVMTLHYDPGRQMIIYDHLAPPKPSLLGHFEYYGPDMSYDGFKYEENHWNYVPKVEILNPKRKNTVYK